MELVTRAICLKRSVALNALVVQDDFAEVEESCLSAETKNFLEEMVERFTMVLTSQFKCP